MSRGRAVLVAVALALLLAAGLWVNGQRVDGPTRPAADDQPPPSRTLASVTASDPELRIDVTAVRRVTRDILEVRLRLTNPDPARPLVLDGRFADRPEEAGTFSGAYLVPDTGTGRYFVLRDHEGRPACSVDASPLAPGAARDAWMRFAGPGRSSGRITLRIKGLPPLTGLPLPDAP